MLMLLVVWMVKVHTGIGTDGPDCEGTTWIWLCLDYSSFGVDGEGTL